MSNQKSRRRTKTSATSSGRPPGRHNKDIFNPPDERPGEKQCMLQIPCTYATFRSWKRGVISEGHVDYESALKTLMNFKGWAVEEKIS